MDTNLRVNSDEKPLRIRLVSATRVSEEAFLQSTALGRSFRLYSALNEVDLRLFADNTRGLSEVYNAAIEEAVENPALLLFIHDDVHLLDFYWASMLRAGLQRFDVLGVAGTMVRVPGQPNWCVLNDQLDRVPMKNFSGLVGHGLGYPCDFIHLYGP